MLNQPSNIDSQICDVKFGKPSYEDLEYIFVLRNCNKNSIVLQPVFFKWFERGLICIDSLKDLILIIDAGIWRKFGNFW